MRAIRAGLALVGLLVVVAMAARLGFVLGRADGHQIAQNEARAVVELRAALLVELRGALSSNKAPTAAAVADAWEFVRGKAIARDRAWRARGWLERAELVRPIFNSQNPPELMPAGAVKAN